LGSPFFCLTGTGTTSSLKRPSFHAAVARWWLRTAQRSDASRVMPYSRTICSVDSAAPELSP